MSSEAQIAKWHAEAKAQGWAFVSKECRGRGFYRHLHTPGGKPCNGEDFFQMAAMRSGQVRCSKCLEELWRTEADRRGWTFLKKIESSRMAVYEHQMTPEGIPCGYQQEVEPGGMRRGGVRCKGCQNPLDGWKADAAAQGWDLLHKVAEGKGKYKHLKKPDGSECGYTQDVFVAQMHSGGVRCAGCQNPHTAWSEAATAQGWSLVGPAGNGQAVFTHLRCSHDKTMEPSAMVRGTAVCDECEGTFTRWAEEALAQGWKLLRQVDSHSGEYEHLFKHDGITPCKHKQTGQATHMRRGPGIQCRVCGRAPSTRIQRLNGDLATWKREALDKGWDLIALLPGGIAEYRHLTREDGSACNHSQPGSRQAMRRLRNGLRCGGCQKPEDLWAEDAQAKGWLFLWKIDSHNGKYEHLFRPDGAFCGERRDVQFAQMHGRSGVSCFACDDRARAEAALALGWKFLGASGPRQGLYEHVETPEKVPCGHQQPITYGLMQGTSPRCNVCQDPTLGWARNAEKWGWRFIEKVDRHTARFLHVLCEDGTPCNHKKVFGAGAMAKGRVLCDECQGHLLRWRQEAEAIGWEFLEPVDGVYGLYRHVSKRDGTPCGNKETNQASQVRAGRVRCGGCQDPTLRWRVEAARQGWEFLSQVDGGRGLYRHLQTEGGAPCGHEQPVIAASMRLGQVRCGSCQDRQLGWEEAALANGWAFQERTTVGKANYLHTLRPDKQPCLWSQEVHIVQMQRKSVCCGDCGDPNFSLLHQLVGDYLADLDEQGLIVCEPEHRFGASPMPGRDDRKPEVDFLVTSTQPNLIIEVDGTQHFLRGFSRDEAAFRNGVVRDVFVDGLAIAKSMAILRFGSWEDASNVIAAIQERLDGGGPDTRLVEDMDFSIQAVHPQFWSWRQEAKDAFAARLGVAWGKRTEAETALEALEETAMEEPGVANEE